MNTTHRDAPEIRVASSCTFRIWIAGDFTTAQSAVRDFCYGEGACFAVSPVEYIYTGGQESGVCVTLIHYPRFPSSETELWMKARRLAEQLRVRLCQHSYSIEGPRETTFYSFRKEPQ